VDTNFDRIYTFNFFPTKQANDQIKLKEAAEAKISAFLTLLGGDAALLTEGEPINSHELFNKLLSKEILTGENETEESELKYLQVIKTIRDEDPKLFEKIRHLPKKARTARVHPHHKSALITYFRRDKLQKFFLAKSAGEAEELDFLSAAKVFEAETHTKQEKIIGVYYKLLDKNKQAFIYATTEELPDVKLRGGRDSATQVLRILKATLKDRSRFTDDQELYLEKVLTQIEEGGLPKQTTKETLKSLNALKNDITNPFKVLALLQINIPRRLLASHYAENSEAHFGKREVILSEYLTD